MFGAPRRPPEVFGFSAPGKPPQVSTFGALTRPPKMSTFGAPGRRLSEVAGLACQGGPKWMIWTWGDLRKLARNRRGDLGGPVPSPRAFKGICEF